MTHICVGKLIIIGSDNGLSPDRRQAIIWTNARLLSIGPLRTYFNENLIKIQQFSLKKMPVKTSSAKYRPSCLSLNVLKWRSLQHYTNVESVSMWWHHNALSWSYSTSNGTFPFPFPFAVVWYWSVLQARLPKFQWNNLEGYGLNNQGCLMHVCISLN